MRLQTGRTIKTVIFAETQAWAIALAKQAYGQQNVIAIVEDDSHRTKPLSPEQQRIKSLNDQAKRYRDLAKQAKAQSTLKKAQSGVASLSIQSKS